MTNILRERFYIKGSSEETVFPAEGFCLIFIIVKRSPSENVAILAAESSEALGRKVASELGLPLTKFVKKQFQDGEICHKLPHDSLNHRHTVIIGTTHDDSAHMELLDLMGGAKEFGAASVNVVIPYLGYSTMERTKPGSNEILKGIIRIRSIFRAHPQFVAFIDLHSEVFLHAHDGSVATAHIQTTDLAADKIREMDIGNPVLVSPDYGRAKWVGNIAEKLKIPHVVAKKDRYADDNVAIEQISNIVRNNIAIICDDIIRTGGTMIKTGTRCKEAGAQEVMYLATHLVLAQNALKKFQKAGAKKIIGSDTYPGRESDGFLEIYSVASLIAETIRRHLPLDEREDRSSLHTKDPLTFSLRSPQPRGIVQGAS